jgi:hypothetical protein
MSTRVGAAWPLAWLIAHPELRAKHKKFVAITKDEEPKVVAESDDLDDLLDAVSDRLPQLYIHQFP